MQNEIDTWLERDGLEIRITAEYAYSAGSPATHWSPEECPEVELECIIVISPAGYTLTLEDLTEDERDCLEEGCRLAGADWDE